MVHRELPWSQLLLASLAGTALCLVLTAVNLRTTEDAFGGLVVAQPDSPAASVLQRDLGDSAVGPGGHDGAYFYVVARDPFNVIDLERSLDAPAYRLQRIGFPLAAWLLHPTGGGDGLVAAMAAVGIVAVFCLGLSVGALSSTLGGSALAGAFAGVLPGAWTGLRITAGDTAALALALGAIACDARGRGRWAVVLGVGAALTRETAVLVFVGWLLSRRSSSAIRLAVIPAVVALAWYLLLRTRVPVGVNTSRAFAAPFLGLAESTRQWVGGVERSGAVVLVLTLALAIVAFARAGLRHPLTGVVIVQVALLIVVAADVVGPERNVARTTLPLAAAALVMLAAPMARVTAAGDLPSRSDR